MRKLSHKFPLALCALASLLAGGDLRSQSLSTALQAELPDVSCVPLDGDMQRCVSARYGAQIEAPKDWLRAAPNPLKDKGFTMMRKDQLLYAMVFYFPKAQFQKSSVSVLAKDYQPPGFSDTTWSDPESVQVGGEEAQRLTLAGKLNNLRMKMRMQFMNREASGAYLLLTGGTESEVDKHAALLVAIEQSFRKVVMSPIQENATTPQHPGGGSDFKSTRGNLKLRLPDGWVTAPELNAEAVIAAKRKDERGYAIVLAINRDDYTADETLAHYAETSIAARMKALSDPHTGEAVRLKVNGWPALQYEMQGDSNNLHLSYLRTYVDSGTQFVTIVVWGTRSNYRELKEEYAAISQSLSPSAK